MSSYFASDRRRREVDAPIWSSPSVQRQTRWESSDSEGEDFRPNSFKLSKVGRESSRYETDSYQPSVVWNPEPETNLWQETPTLKSGFDWMSQHDDEAQIRAEKQKRREKEQILSQIRQKIDETIDKEIHTRLTIESDEEERWRLLYKKEEEQRLELLEIEEMRERKKREEQQKQDLLRRAKEEMEWANQERQRREEREREKERQLREKQKQLEEQKKAEMEKAKRSSKEKAESEKNNGNAMYKSGRYQEAIACYTRAINLDPNNAAYFANRAAAHLMMRNHNGCIEDCTQSLQRDSKYVKALIRRGKCYVQMDQWEDAVRDLELAVKYENTPENMVELDECWRRRCEYFESSRPKVRDHYKVLGMKPGADIKDIKKAFHKMALQWHPDRHHEALCDNQVRFAEIIFKEVSEAHTVLTDPNKKEQWEKELEEYTRVASTPVAPPPVRSTPQTPQTVPTRPAFPAATPHISTPPVVPPQSVNQSTTRPRPAPSTPNSTGVRSFSNTTFVPNSTAGMAPPAPFTFPSEPRVAASSKTPNGGGITDAYSQSRPRGPPTPGLYPHTHNSATQPRPSSTPSATASATTAARRGSSAKATSSYF